LVRLASEGMWLLSFHMQAEYRHTTCMAKGAGVHATQAEGGGPGCLTWRRRSREAMG
jgi:hypothetical protein